MVLPEETGPCLATEASVDSYSYSAPALISGASSGEHRSAATSCVRPGKTGYSFLCQLRTKQIIPKSSCDEVVRVAKPVRATVSGWFRWGSSAPLWWLALGGRWLFFPVSVFGEQSLAVALLICTCRWMDVELLRCALLRQSQCRNAGCGFLTVTCPSVVARSLAVVHSSSFLARGKGCGHRAVKGTSGLLAKEWMLRT